MPAQVSQGIATFVVLGLALGLTWGAEALLKRLARRIPGPATAEKTVRVARVVRLARWVVRTIVVFAAALVIAGVWGVSLRAWITQGLGEQLTTGVFRLGLVLVIAVAAFELASFAIEHVIGRISAGATDRRRKAQLTTLAPLLRGLVQTAIVLAATLMALGELGVQIGPLLAGAGVVGIAIGFGAQSVVKDVLTGAFLIFEDIVSVGDVVKIGDSGGLVEQMTLRTIRLRDFDGTLHVFPYGEAQVVHNLTKSFSFYVFDLQVSYSSDIDRALLMMRRVGDGMQQDPAFADKILEPIEVVGVDGLGESGVVLKARIKTQPLQQWAVGREYNRRIKLAFDEEGIEIPFPHMKVVLPDGQLSELARH